MKTVFFCNSDKYFHYVYNDAQLEWLKENTDFDGSCYTPDDVRENPARFADTEYIFSTWMMPSLGDGEVASLFPSLRAIFYAAGTVQYFVRPYMKNGVRVFSAWSANAEPVAEVAAAEILLANKGFFRASGMKNRDEHAKADEAFRKFPGNYGTKVGILGAGMIGKKVIKRLASSDVTVLVFDPFLPDATADALGVTKCSLETVFSECSVVSNHLANNAQTCGMLTGRLFEMMLPHATFLNTGRGAQVNEDELADVLRRRSDLTAILDVTRTEPPIEESPLWALDNCILTPHLAGSSGNEVHRMAEYMLDEYRRCVSGKPCLWEVTEAMLETMA